MSRKPRRPTDIYRSPLAPDSPNPLEQIGDFEFGLNSDPDNKEPESPALEPFSLEWFRTRQPRDWLDSLKPPPPPKVDIMGYWEGGSGSMICLEAIGSRENEFRISGDGMGQKIDGFGSITDDGVKMRINLLKDRDVLEVELAMPTMNKPDCMEGTGTNKNGVKNPVTFHRFAAFPRGTWYGDDASLSIGGNVLEWINGAQEVKAPVSGSIFGRAGKGDVSVRGRNLFGFLKATDFTHRDQYYKKHEKESYPGEGIDWYYARECPREGWWASGSLTMDFEIAADGTSLSGTVAPGYIPGKTGSRSDFKVNLQLRRQTAKPEPRAPRSIL